MGDRLRAGTPPWYETKPTRSTQPCIPPWSLNRVPALFGWVKGGNIPSPWWQVTLCDPIRHVSSRSGEACLRTPILRLLYTYLRACVFVPRYTGESYPYYGEADTGPVRAVPSGRVEGRTGRGDQQEVVERDHQRTQPSFINH